MHDAGKLVIKYLMSQVQINLKLKLKYQLAVSFAEGSDNVSVHLKDNHMLGVTSNKF